MNLNTDYTREAVCPNCLCEVGDSWEFNDNDEYECDCGCVFGVTRIISVTYSTKEIRMNYNDLTLENAYKNIEKYIKRCRYTYKDEDIISDYKDKYLNNRYVSYTMKDTIDKCKRELELLENNK